MRDSYLAKFYWKIKQKRGAKKAIIALARKILVIIYNLLKNKTVYNEDAFASAKLKQDTARIKKLIYEAKKLGLEFVEPKFA